MSFSVTWMLIFFPHDTRITTLPKCLPLASRSAAPICKARSRFSALLPRVEYELTAFGATLEPILLQLREWGERYKRRIG